MSDYIDYLLIRICKEDYTDKIQPVILNYIFTEAGNHCNQV